MTNLDPLLAGPRASSLLERVNDRLVLQGQTVQALPPGVMRETFGRFVVIDNAAARVIRTNIDLLTLALALGVADPNDGAPHDEAA
jgi:hypothetical protein